MDVFLSFFLSVLFLLFIYFLVVSYTTEYIVATEATSSLLSFQNLLSLFLPISTPPSQPLNNRPHPLSTLKITSPRLGPTPASAGWRKFDRSLVGRKK